MKQFITTLSLLAATLLSTSAMAASIDGQNVLKDEKSSYVAGRLIVKMKPGVSKDRAENFLNQKSMTVLKTLEIDGAYIATVKEGEEKSTIQALSKDNRVEFVELDRLVPPAFIPNDPYLQYQWHHEKIRTAGAWDVDASNITIAILDTGVEASHPDLSPSLLPGWNTASGNNDTSPIHPHGTEVAGVAAAVVNNALGVAGVAKGAKILPVRITNNSTTGNASISNIVSGILWSVNHGAKIINNSYNTYGSSLISEAANYAYVRGAMTFIGSGNDATTCPMGEDPNLLVIGATDNNDEKAYFSNYGTCVDLVAPGTGITTTAVGNSYSNPAGTSFSSPMVAGLGAVVMAVNPSFSLYDIEKIMKTSAVKITGEDFNPYFGYGRIDATAAVNMARAYAPVVDTEAPAVMIATPSNGQTLNGSIPVSIAANDNTAVLKTELLVNGVVYATATRKPYDFSWYSPTVGNVDHAILTARAYDEAGNVGNSPEVRVNLNNVFDTTPPVITVSSPQPNSRSQRQFVTSLRIIPIQATATDDSGFAYMRLKIDGRPIEQGSGGAGGQNGAALNYTWNVPEGPTADHLIEITAYDGSGNTAVRNISIRVVQK